jgi:hypothetical protein
VRATAAEGRRRACATPGSCWETTTR